MSDIAKTARVWPALEALHAFGIWVEELGRGDLPGVIWQQYRFHNAYAEAERMTTAAEVESGNILGTPLDRARARLEGLAQTVDLSRQEATELALVDAMDTAKRLGAGDHCMALLGAWLRHLQSGGDR